MKWLPTIMAFMALTFSAYSVFHIKQKVKNETKDLLQLNRLIASEQENIHVLEAEWAYLTQSQRIKNLAEQYLDLKPMELSQIKPISYIYNEEVAHISDNEDRIRPSLKPLMVSNY